MRVLLASTLLAIAGMTLYVPVGPLVPALHSYWLVIHVGAASTASGIFLVGFVAAAMHLIRWGRDAGKTRFPQAATLERVTFRIHAFAFPIWTFGVMAGAIWARPLDPEREPPHDLLDRRVRLGDDDGQPLRRQPGRQRPALLRGV